MYNALLDRIRPVTRRFQSRRMWWAVTLITVFFAFLAFTAIDSARLGRVDGIRSATTIGLISLAGILIAAIFSRYAYRDPRAIATKIEDKFPNLNQRLLTALSLEKEAENNSLGYLQQRVIKEARDHSRHHDWVDVMPAGQLWSSRLAGVVSTGILAMLLGLLASVKPMAEKQGIASLPDEPLIQVVVQPGNTEVERGTSLAVTARFSEEAPDEAVLVCTSLDSDGNEAVRRIKMTQNLDDPVVGGFVASVDKEFTYQVVTDNWSSEVFSVDVFEFPSLVRSDAALDYPDYTDLEDKLVEDTVRVSAVEGTKVKWLCYLNKPVKSGVLVDKDGNRIELEAESSDDGTALSTEFDLKETRRLTLELVDDQGRKNKYPPELVARVLPNQPPKLKLTNAKDASVSPLEELPLGVEVRDDFGVAQVGLAYRFADQDTKQVVLEEKIARGSKQRIEHLIAFEELGAVPDQLLAYHFWAEDYGPDGQLRRTESDMFFAEVRPFEEIYRQGQPPAGGQQQQQQQNQNGQQAEKLAELQKEIMNATWNTIRKEKGSEPSEEFAINAGVIAESQSDAIVQLQELAGELEDSESKLIAEQIGKDMMEAAQQLTKAANGDYTRPMNPALTAEQAAYGGLLKLRAREFQVMRQQQRQQQGQQSASQQRRQQQLDDLELDQEENRYETQQQAQANSPEEQEQREVRQVLNRLRELARRQEDLNKQLAELQSALEQAKTEKEKEEIERQLKRLRDQQQDLLRETDELSERMQSPENAETMSEANEQLEQTRENVRKATEALEKKDASEALTAGKRAEREFEDMRDDFRKRAAGQFNDAVREMRSSAQKLDETQEELSEKLDKMDTEDNSPGLRGNNQRDSVTKQLDEQRERLGELLDKMQRTVEEAEAAEPLLAEKLYDSFRKTQQRQVDRRLQDTAELFKRGFDAEAREAEGPAREGIQKLREELESAAESVLGDETEGLRRALGELDQLSEDLDREIDNADPTARGQRNPQRGSDDQRRQDGQRDPSQQNPGGQQNENGQRSDDRQPSQSGRSENGEPNDRGDLENDQSEKRQGRGQQRDSEQQENRQGRNGSPSDQETDQQGQKSQGEPQEGQPSQQGQQPSEQSGQPNQSGQQNPQDGQQNPQDGQQNPQDGQQPNGQPNQSGSPQGQGQPQDQPNQQSQAGQNPSGQNQSQQNDQPRDGRQQGGQERNGGLSQFAADSPSSQPIAGDGFRDWSDRLRDVEEMVESSELRSRAARIRDRAREVRVELKRHSKTPQWRLVEEMIAQPLRELRRDVQEELLRRSAEKNSLVPIDRDPVPDQYTDAVQQYYENLGSGR